MKHIDNQSIKILPINFRMLRNIEMNENEGTSNDKLVSVKAYKSLQSVTHHHKHISKIVSYDLG
jgi:hypothetical protein